MNVLTVRNFLKPSALKVYSTLGFHWNAPNISPEKLSNRQQAKKRITEQQEAAIQAVDRIQSEHRVICY